MISWAQDAADFEKPSKTAQILLQTNLFSLILPCEPSF